MSKHSALRLLVVIYCLLGFIGTSEAETARWLDVRMAAWHHTIVATDEMRPNSCVSTYDPDHFTYCDSPLLAKLVAGIEKDGKTIWPASAKAVKVDDTPGTVVASYILDGVRVSTEIVPSMIGRDTPEWDGAAFYSVKTAPPTPLIVRCGFGGVASLWNPRTTLLRNDDVGFEGDVAEMTAGIAMLRSSKHVFSVAVNTGGSTAIEKGEHGGEYIVIRFEGGSGQLLVGFAKDASQAEASCKLDVKAARNQVDQYYRGLMQCKIETPEKVIDQAFRSALYNLEYNWIEPYGWNECIHHWLALWHMQHTGAAEWIGQADRSRLCNITTAENLLTNDAVPQFIPNGMTHRDFGGSNQFFAWQVRHYWNFTADRKAIEQIAPQLDKIIAQTYTEYDPDRDGLLAWGQQIGNQEDYVSTPFNGTSPSVEGINMLRTAATFARSLGQKEKAEQYEDRADQTAACLRSELWQADLGRFAFYKDPYGVVRADGQYHTLIHPVIWGILDPLDSWTSIGHLRDRLTGSNGEVYCSNNFPNHVGSTLGMQAGAAQQPWAAWGLAAVGLRNETYRPLKAVAEWVMNDDHRGSWPEIALEPTPAYFSPPAGLFIQSTIEALFGLKVNRLEGWLEVAPSFPDHWPSAKLTLPEFSAEYARKGNTVEYVVRGKAPLARRLRWILPPCHVSKVLVNGKEAKYELLPAVNCVILRLDTPPNITTRFTIIQTPLKYNLTYPGSVAEGERFTVTATGCKIRKIDDRCGVLADMTLDAGGFRASVRNGLLKPYRAFGRLGQMNFSRRTFFLLCERPKGPKFWAPVELTILPKYEACVRSEIRVGQSGGTIRFQVRNNTFSILKGNASLKVIQQIFPFQVNVPARSQCEYSVVIPKDDLALFSPGENSASVTLPSGHQIPLTVVASKLYEKVAQLYSYAQSRIVQIPLPEQGRMPDANWREVRNFYAYGHVPWVSSKPPMEAIAGKSEVAVPKLPAVSFKIDGRRFIPVSWKLGLPSFVLDLKNEQCKKLYILMIPFLDNHDTFSTVARVDAITQDGGIISRTLTFPGDLDWWCPAEVVGEFATARKPRPDRFGLLPMLNTQSKDWKIASPPDYPQPEYWATCLSFKTPSSVMNVVEIDLGRVVSLKSLAISTLSADAALGIVAVSAERSGGQEVLRGTEWLPKAEFREPRELFVFKNEDDLAGWRLEGQAFSVASFPRLFTVPTLNSLAKSGESATGKAISPDFTIGDGDNYLRFQLQGGISEAAEGPGTLCIKLVDSATGDTLHNMQMNGSHILREAGIPIGEWRGRTIHLELVDENTGGSYAWLGIRAVTLSGR